jgi:hypothetical protein
MRVGFGGRIGLWGTLYFCLNFSTFYFRFSAISPRPPPPLSLSSFPVSLLSVAVTRIPANTPQRKPRRLASHGTLHHARLLPEIPNRCGRVDPLDCDGCGYGEWGVEPVGDAL